MSTRVRILAYVSPYISSKGGKHRDITISISERPLHFMGLRRLHEPNWNIERRVLPRAQLLASSHNQVSDDTIQIFLFSPFAYAFILFYLSFFNSYLILYTFLTHHGLPILQ